jgi:hypothetical protein
MFRILTIKRSALAVVLAGAVVATSEAQAAPPGFTIAGYCTGGLSTLTGSFARFHIALDDDSSEPGIVVVMRYVNEAGTVIKSKTANIVPGGSATLEYRGSAVLFRAQAEIFESLDLINRSRRRTVVASEEREAALFTAAGDAGFRLIGPGPMRVSCVDLNSR